MSIDHCPSFLQRLFRPFRRQFSKRQHVHLWAYVLGLILSLRNAKLIHLSAAAPAGGHRTRVGSFLSHGHWDAQALLEVLLVADYGSSSPNFVYADVDGNIGYQMPGRIPIRAKGDGQLPVPGWTGEYDWTGYIPFDQLPRAYNPPKGYIATANNAVVGPGFPYFISMEWDRGYRARRIVDLLEGQDKLSPDDFAAIQGDSFDIAAQQIIPYLKDITVEGDAQKVLDAIKSWDVHTTEQSAGGGAYQVFRLHLLRNTFDDDLGDLAKDYVSGNDVNQQEMILLLAQPGSKWWDNAATPDRVENRDDILKQSLADAARDLVAQYGADPKGWQWGKLHTITFVHRALGTQPVAFIYNRGQFPGGGYGELVNATGGNFAFAYGPGDPKLTDIMKETSGPSLRQIVARFVDGSGGVCACGHPHA